MQRRKFILGLGTAATLSGAASVTGATFADSVTPDTTSFQVIAEANLVASGERDETFDDPQADGANNNDEDYVTTDGIQFDDIDQEDIESLPAAFADGDTDEEDLTVELAFERGNDGEIDPVLQIQNEGDTDEEVGITFEDGEDSGAFGSAVDGEIDAADVVDAIQFEAGGSTISPTSDEGFTDEDNQEPDNFETVEAGGELDVTINIDGSAIDEDDLAAESSADGAFEGDTDNVELVESILIGTEE